MSKIKVKVNVSLKAECNVCLDSFIDWKLISFGCCRLKICKDCAALLEKPECPGCRSKFAHG